MKKLYAVISALILMGTSIQLKAQISFANKSTKLTNVNIHSGCPVTVVDWNNDGLDDIIRLDAGRNAVVEVQRTNDLFQSINLGSFSTNSGWAWGMCAADLDHNGFIDVIAGGNGPAVKIMMTDANGLMGSIISLPSSSFFVQNLTCGDFNNDGWIDLFACDDNAMSHIFLNNGTGGLVESFSTINFDVTSTDDSGNYGSVWTDFDNDGDMDLYIAKCRQGVNSPTDGRRINVMFVNDGNGNYTESAAAYGLNIGWQSWTASFGDIDNDADLDLLVTNHDYQSQILENDGSGHYTDITASTGFDITDITPIQSVMEDFDNDGYVDLLITGSTSRFYRNNGNKTFTKMEGLFNTNNMESFAIGDLNHDGRTDIYASYATIYTNPSSVNDAIWMNNTRNDNHFVTLQLTGTVSNKGAIGASARVYGAWGTQLREVRAGESYGSVNSAMLHFGLGSTTSIDSIVVRFPSGVTQTLIQPESDQFIRIIENDCVSPAPGITYSQPATYICSGNTETITAAPGFDYLWSDNSTNSTLSITAGGEYNVLISTPGNNCSALSPTLIIEQDPDQTPVISAIGETEICNGSTVELIPAAYGISSYLWSNGDNTASTQVGQTGAFTLTVQGYCASFTSNTINVVSHLVPDPIASNVSLPAAGQATLTATGTIINWYDAPNATTPIYTGSSFTTPFINNSANYWVENVEKYNAGTYNTGVYAHGGSTLYSGTGTTNAQTYFNVAKPCTLKTVKVYTDTPGMRRFELRNSQNVLMQYADVMVSPDTQIVSLNFILSPGNNYRLGTSDSVNALIPGWGQAGPRLRRNFGGAVTYPYTIPNGLSITGNSIGTQYYFYFYDWSVELSGLSCSSNRIQVTASVTTGLQSASMNGFEIYPNPAENMIFLNNPSAEPGLIRVFDATGRMVISSLINEGKSTLDVDGLQSGLYTIELSSAETRHQAKLMIR